jgi:hypothetical protein
MKVIPAYLMKVIPAYLMKVIMIVPDEGYFRNTSCTLNLISKFSFRKNQQKCKVDKTNVIKSS